MKTINRITVVVSGIALCLCVHGCFAYKSHQLPVIDKLPTPPNGQEPLQVDYSLGSRQWYNINRVLVHGGDALRKFEAEFVSVLKESGYFGAVFRGNYGGDIFIDLDLSPGRAEGGTPMALAYISIIVPALYFLPIWWFPSTVSVKAVVTTIDHQRREYLLQDGLTMSWCALYIVVAPFVTPFFWPRSVESEVRKNIYRNLIVQMHRDGLLSPPTQAQPQVNASPQ